MSVCCCNKIVNGRRLKCIKENNHEGEHLTHDNIEWSLPKKRKKLCSHNIRVDDKNLLCELPEGHKGSHINGDYEWVCKKQIRREGICYYCHETRGTMTIDHIIPLSQGGKNTTDNYVPSCKNCNSDKSALSLEEYAIKSFKRFASCCKRMEISPAKFLKNYLERQK